MKRAHISLKTKLAAALLQMKRYVGDGEWVNIIPHEEAKTLTADQIISRFHFNHHPIPHAHGGPDEPWNLDPEPVERHREITAKIDIPRIAKAKRVARAHAEHQSAVASKATGERAQPRQKPGKRPWPKGRKIQSQGFKTAERRT